jgi:hypothetical protein
MRAAILILFSCALLQATPFFQSAPLSEPAGELKGVLLDPNGARVVSGSIIIEGRNFRRELAPNEEGNFQAELPAGVYRVTVNSMGFRRFRRKNIKVESNPPTTMKITLSPVALSSYSKCRGLCL